MSDKDNERGGEHVVDKGVIERAYREGFILGKRDSVLFKKSSLGSELNQEKRNRLPKFVIFEYIIWHIVCFVYFMDALIYNKYSMSATEVIEFFFAERGLFVTFSVIIVNLTLVLLRETPLHSAVNSLKRKAPREQSPESIDIPESIANGSRRSRKNSKGENISNSVENYLNGDIDDEDINYILRLQFKESISRASQTMYASQSKPIALIFVGTFISVIGMAFFVATLPTVESLSLDRLLAEVPRLLMLLFIQVLAGFFLRQYRSSTEDFRYYEMSLKHRESQFLAYLAAKQFDDKVMQNKLVEDLLLPRDTMKLQKGETTITIETDKIHVNEFSDITGKSFSFLEGILKSLKEKKE